MESTSVDTSTCGLFKHISDELMAVAHRINAHRRATMATATANLRPHGSTAAATPSRSQRAVADDSRQPRGRKFKSSGLNGQEDATTPDQVQGGHADELDAKVASVERREPLRWTSEML